MDEHRKSLAIVTIDKRMVYKSVGWWLKFGSRPKSELSCVHDVKLNIHCQACAKQT